MRQGKILYKGVFAGILTETNEGEYVFQYDAKYADEHPNNFITFNMPVSLEPYRDKRLFPAEQSY